LLEFRALEHVDKIRQSNGVIHNDYERYHKYCSKRILTIRQKLKFHGGNRNKSYAYRKIDPANVSDVRHIELPLVLSERCIAQRHTTNENGRRYSLDRLKKSTVFAKHLNNLVREVKCTFVTLLESEIYVHMVRGNYYSEESKFPEAAQNFVIAGHLCELYLSKTEDESKIQKLKNHIDDIGEKISYCHYSSENPIGDQNEILEEYKLGPGSKIFEAIENQPDLTISTTPSDANKQLNNMLKKIDSMKRSGKIDDQKILRRFDLVCFKAKSNGATEDEISCCQSERLEWLKCVQKKSLAAMLRNMTIISQPLPTTVENQKSKHAFKVENSPFLPPAMKKQMYTLFTKASTILHHIYTQLQSLTPNDNSESALDQKNYAQPSTTRDHFFAHQQQSLPAGDNSEFALDLKKQAEMMKCVMHLAMHVEYVNFNFNNMNKNSQAACIAGHINGFIKKKNISKCDEEIFEEVQRIFDGSRNKIMHEIKIRIEKVLNGDDVNSLAPVPLKCENPINLESLEYPAFECDGLELDMIQPKESNQAQFEQPARSQTMPDPAPAENDQEDAEEAQNATGGVFSRIKSWIW